MSSVYKNTALNIISQILIMLIMFVAIPFIVRGLGEVSFSILSLVWTVIGYFALWDLGIGRAVTKFVAEKKAAGKQDELVIVIFQAAILSVVIGIVMGVVLLTFESNLSRWLFTVPRSYDILIVRSLRIVAVAMPVLVLQGTLRGALMGLSRFDLTNLLQIANGVFQWGGALCLVLLKYDVVTVIGFVLLSRIMVTIFHYYYLRKLVNLRVNTQIADRRVFKSLVGYGGWAMVSQAVSPILQYTERFMLSGLIATGVVAYYVVSYEATAKLLVLSVGLVSALFPAFSEMQGKDEGHADLSRLYRSSERILIFSFLPMGVILVGFAPELLTIWMGAQFSSHSAVAFQILAIAFVINSVSQMPFTHLQAIGRTDITGRIHLAELPIHIIAAYALVSLFGVVGAAVATLARIVLDGSLLYYFSSRKMVHTVPANRSGLRDIFLVVSVAIAGVAVVLALASNELMKVAFSAVWIVIYIAVVFGVVLENDERQAIAKLVPGRNHVC